MVDVAKMNMKRRLDLRDQPGKAVPAMRLSLAGVFGDSLIRRRSRDLNVS